LIAGSDGKYNLATIFRPEDDQIRPRIRGFLEKLLPLVFVALFPVPRFQRKRKVDAHHLGERDPEPLY